MQLINAVLLILFYVYLAAWISLHHTCYWCLPLDPLELKFWVSHHVDAGNQTCSLEEEQSSVLNCWAISPTVFTYFWDRFPLCSLYQPGTHCKSPTPSQPSRYGTSICYHGWHWPFNCLLKGSWWLDIYSMVELLFSMCKVLGSIQYSLRERLVWL